MLDKIKNKFSLTEWSGAVGDLGTLLPLAFALVVFNEYNISRLFLLWGLVYIIAGIYYKVPVSVQPLKAMAVIAISTGISVEFLASTSFFYGILLIILSLTGAIRWLQKWFSNAMVKGIQFGIGLILAHKAIQLVFQKGLLLYNEPTSKEINLMIFLALVTLLWLFQVKKKFPLALLLIAISVPVITFILPPETHMSESKVVSFVLPDIHSFVDALVLLIIPQLPLTLGNAMFAASDTCHSFWGNRAKKVTPVKLGLSIGISDTIIGLFGGFPVCHGAGGIAAHKQFGGKTGGTIIILGGILILFGLVTPLSQILFFIPVPLLAAMLLFDSGRMVLMLKKTISPLQFVVAFIVGIISFITRNLTIALVVGLIIEKSYIYLKKRREKFSEL